MLKLVFEMRNLRSLYWFFSMKYVDLMRYIYFVLVSVDGKLMVYENE